MMTNILILGDDRFTYHFYRSTPEKGGKMTSQMKNKEGGNPVTAVVIGAGSRGSGYPRYALQYPDRLQIVGVADPRKFYRERIQEKYNIVDQHVFEDWKDIASKEKFADCAIICTPDRGKVTEEDCKEIVKVCKENKVILAVCHVLRYTPWATKLRELIQNGAIGDVVNIQHLEPVGYWHFAHSFVRGNWRRQDTSTFSLLAKCSHDVDLITYWMGNRRCRSVSSFGQLTHFNKENKVGYWHFAHSYVRGNWHREDRSACSLLAKCCHDIDLITYWMGDRRCEGVSSFGKLTHFTKENKPKNASSRCIDCPQNIESVCPYSAKKIYLEQYKKALKTGPYGRCVYDCDNDVMSQQVVNMQFEGGPTATLSMVAFTESICAREIKIFGTKGELRCTGTSSPVIEYVNFCTGERENIRAFPDEKAMSSGLGGHGGADYHCVDSFISAVMNNDQSKILSGPDDTLASHLLVFAAEKARKENIVVNLNKDGTF
ncbi:hypothetical protein KUTeg_017764 [Tegillarca granosa]|uniref:Gfo/Idh/MocA family oxidoreductase n=1 Tax=Tegillarca granosa TaxID=220873 RepID=A0ABQ9EJW6_TEGGR|nr:hypothetical protein KUTeg_017764 [Tegillarca granosa]